MVPVDDSLVTVQLPYDFVGPDKLDLATVVVYFAAAPVTFVSVYINLPRPFTVLTPDGLA